MALMPQRGLPVPPMPVLPPEGIAPVTDPASSGTAPDASPTTMVLQYLKSRGFTPTSENVRRALEANQRDPGVIPGLRSDRPATEAEDQAAMAAAGRGGGGGGGGGSKNTSAPPPGGDLAHPVDLNWQTVNPNPPASGGGGDGVSDAAKIAMMALGGAGGMGALGYGAYKLADRFNPPPVAGPGASVPPPVDPGAGVRTGAPPETIFPGSATQANPQVAPSPAEQVTPLDTAINRAVPGSVADLNPVARPGSLDMTPPRGPVAPVELPPNAAPVVPFRSDPALRTSPTLRGEVPPVRPVVRPGRLRLS